ncbi:inverse autotransporter beta domain-containing protein [Candidatus Pelagibacter sp.]|nr:inverse autotransporter beta domain-containing protein [Candidatus Pelagibacter sp.]
MNLFKYLILILYFLTFGSTANAENIKSKVENKIYSKIDDFAQNIGEDFANSFRDFENLKYLDFSLNVQEGFDPSIQIESVSKLIEFDDGALFNQLNLISQDSKTTINLGVGKRKLYDSDTYMLGTNFFIDYQFDESHLRSGLGFEAISNSLDFIANYYNAISGFKTTGDGREKALDGYDLKLNYHLPNQSNTDFFVQLFEWENPSSTYEEKGEKLGITSSIGNLALEIGYLNDNKDNDGLFGSLKVVIPLGEQREILNKDDENNNKSNLNVRNKLYMPVQRENKIKLVQISSGVKVSGF